jgi:hypothetical protein
MAAGPKPYDPRKPYNRRTYYVRPPAYRAYRGQAGQPSPGAFEAGSQYGGDIVQGIVNIMQQRRMEAIANQILNTRNAPRAGLVAPGVNPQTGQANVIPTGVSTAGTAPATGGTLELAMRNEQAKAELANQRAQLEDALKRAQIQDYLAKAAGTGYYAKRAAGLTPAAQLAEQHRQYQEDERLRQATLTQARKEQAANTDTLPKVLKDFSALYPGKTTDDTGATVTHGEAIYNSLNQGSGARGNVINGQFIGDPNGEYYTWQGDAHGKAASQVPKVRWDVLQPFMSRVDAIQKAGGKVVPPMVARALPVRGQPAAPAPAPAQTTETTGEGELPSGVSPEVPVPSDSDSGASAQLPTPQTQDDYEAIPSGSDFIDVDGIQKTKT